MNTGNSGPCGKNRNFFKHFQKDMKLSLHSHKGGTWWEMMYMYTSKCLNRRTLPSDLLDLYVPMFIGRTRKCDTISGGSPFRVLIGCRAWQRGKPKKDKFCALFHHVKHLIWWLSENLRTLGFTSVLGITYRSWMLFFSNIRPRETSQKNLGLEYLELMVAKT